MKIRFEINWSFKNLFEGLGFFKKLNLRIGVVGIKFERNWNFKKLFESWNFRKLNLRIGILKIK